LISISHVEVAGTHYVFTNNNNSVIKYYRLQGETLVFEDEICFSLNKIIESIALFAEDGRLMVFLGGVDEKIHYFELELAEHKSKLEYKFSLSGHENAITKLTITKDQSDDILLASASKDGYIRIWKITSNIEEIKFHKNINPILSNRKIFLEAVLISHECSVTSLAWVRYDGVLQLASSSLDCTVCLWGNSTGEAWSVDSRMGQFIGNKNAYFDVLADPAHQYLAALNYTGALLMWQWQNKKFSLIDCFNGHSNLVKGLEWNYSGSYLVSASKDQTTRVIALSN
jgi:elongator complex protein 2